MSKKQKHTETFLLKLTPADKKELQAMAKKYTRGNLSEYLRLCGLGLLTFCLLVLNSSCGAMNKSPDIEPALEPIYQSYLDMAPSEGNVEWLKSIKFGVPPEGANGVCHDDTKKIGGDQIVSGGMRIVIKPTDDMLALKLTVFHELGHCLHGLHHTAGDYDVMNPQRALNHDYFEANWPVAVRDMFSQPHR